MQICDGIVTDEDCNDNDTSLLEQSNDQDCDGVVTADDCNDNDVSLLEQSNDQDCDGYLSGEDCDDSNANAFLDNGKSSSCAASTCQSILNDGLSSGDGTYWVSITGKPYGGLLRYDHRWWRLELGVCFTVRKQRSKWLE